VPRSLCSVLPGRREIHGIAEGRCSRSEGLSHVTTLATRYSGRYRYRDEVCLGFHFSCISRTRSIIQSGVASSARVAASRRARPEGINRVADVLVERAVSSKNQAGHVERYWLRKQVPGPGVQLFRNGGKAQYR